MLQYLKKYFRYIAVGAGILIASMSVLFSMNGSDSFTIASGEAIVLSFPKVVESINFSKDSGFTIRTLEGGRWIDISNQVSDYTPLRGYLIRNSGAGNLIIDVDYALLSSVEQTLFQKDLPAGWNLVGVAFRDDVNGAVSVNDAFGESLPYSQAIDFTGNNFSNQNNSQIINDSELSIRSRSELSTGTVFERLAYALFVNVNSAISGTQRLDETGIGSDLGGTSTTASLTVNPLATTLVVRGSENIQVHDFIVEAGDNSILGVDSISISGEFVQLNENSGIADISSATNPQPITNNEVLVVSLYADSIAPGNLLGVRSGNDLDANGEVRFNNFDNIFIEENDEQRFLVTIDVVDSGDVEFIGFRNFSLTDIVIEDQNNNTLDITGLPLSISQGVLITPIGQLFAEFDDSNRANADPKTLLAGASDQVVFSIDVSSVNEPTRVEDVVFTLEGSDVGDIRNAISNASLYLNDTFLATNTNADINVVSPTRATITFADVSTLVIPEQTAELELRVNTNAIGGGGGSLSDVSVTGVLLSGISGSESDTDIDDVTALGSSQPFSVAPATPQSGTSTTASLTVNPLATTLVVRGSENIQVHDFIVEAGDNSILGVDSISISGEFVQLNENSGIADISSATNPQPITNNEVLVVSLYADSIAPGNLLGVRSGNDLDANGEVRFNNFDNIFIEENDEQRFLVTIDVVDSGDVEFIGFRNFSLTDIVIEDQNNNTLDITGLPLSISQGVLITPIGQLFAEFDDSNRANADPKTLLAGASDQVVFSIDVSSVNEPTRVEDVVFTLEGSDVGDIRNAISNASLYLNDTFLATNTNADINVVSPTRATITFADVSTLVIPEQTAELELRVNTNAIGGGGGSLSDVSVTGVLLSGISGSESDTDIDDVTALGSSQPFSVAPATLQIGVVPSFINPTISISANANTAVGDITINSVILDTTGTTHGTIITISTNDGIQIQQLEVGVDDNNGILTFDLSSLAIADRTVLSGSSESFEFNIITPDLESPVVSLEILRDGLNYTVSGETFTTNASEDLELTN